MEVCSPSRAKVFNKNKTCFDKEALVRLAKAWNEIHPTTKISGIATKSKHDLWTAINTRMSDVCKGSGREWCWIDKVGPAAKASPAIAKSLRPSKPAQWYDKPYTWLSNYDIDAVMKQYQDVPENHYKFLGVFPVDFATKDKFGTCLYNEICGLDIAKFAKKGIKYIGLITNMDRHDEPGSHWTSMFACIDPSMPAFGVFYYDSVSSPPPPEVASFMSRLKAQADGLSAAMATSKRRRFRIDYNKKKDQFGNTECGMFSIVYQLKWMDMLKVNPTATFEDVLKNRMSDQDVHTYRDVLFRPNTKAEVDKKA